MDNKQVKKVFVRMVDKFVSISTQYDAGLATETQLKKCACDQLAVCLRLKEVETLRMDTLVNGWLDIIKADRDALEIPINKVCGELYTLINQAEE